MRTLTQFLDATDRAGVEPVWETSAWMQRHRSNEKLRRRVRDALADVANGHKTASLALDDIADAIGEGSFE
ncbi:hypothetical protein OKW33_000821 [Paraburkholderia atlantica]|uniref:hypothetical protein n=1 Tax=Paraburkholderia atlantica TaxID=2654982 RepID=UPI003D1BBF65